MTADSPEEKAVVLDLDDHASRAWDHAQEMHHFNNHPDGMIAVRVDDARCASIIFDEMRPQSDTPFPVVAVYSDDGHAQVRAPGSVLRGLADVLPGGDVHPDALKASDLEGQWSMNLRGAGVPSLAVDAALAAAVLRDAHVQAGKPAPGLKDFMEHGPWSDFKGDTLAQTAVSVAAYAQSAKPLEVFQKLGGDLARDDRAAVAGESAQKATTGIMTYARRQDAPEEVLHTLRRAVTQAHVRQTATEAPTVATTARSRVNGEAR